MSRNNNKRILDRSNYSAKTISTYSIMGAYMVDIYYNYIYAEAVKLKNSRKFASITEGYKHSVINFLSNIDKDAKRYKPAYYMKLLEGIKGYFTTWTSFSTLTTNDCVNMITREFVPIDYYDALDRDQKYNILRTILISSIKEFTKAIIHEFLSIIIDNHDDPASIDLLNEKIIDLLIMEREKIYYKFIVSNTGKKSEVVDKKSDR